MIDNINSNKKYQIIYADPPWKYGGSGGSKWSPASEYYNVMPLKDIIAMKPDIDNIADENSCLLFMWCCGPTVQDAITLGNSWGFEYITVAFVWNKQRANVGNYTMSSCEFVLLFKKGKIPEDRVRNPGTLQFLSMPIGEHSKKPYVIRDRISNMFPKSNKIELFSRDLVDGWDCFGDYFSSSQIITANDKNIDIKNNKKSKIV